MFSSLNSTLLNSNIILELMHKKNLYPIPKQEIKKIKFNKKLVEITKSKLSNITKSHFKEFLFSGLSLLLLSLVIPFSSHYLIIGTILLTISIISLFRKDFSPKEDNTDFFFD